MSQWSTPDRMNIAPVEIRVERHVTYEVIAEAHLGAVEKSVSRNGQYALGPAARRLDRVARR
jgi:hypothetical protein